MFKRLRWLIFPLIFSFVAACTLTQTQAPPEIIPTLVVEAPPEHAGETLDALLATDPPSRDLAELAQRLKGVDVQPIMPITPQVGDVETFWYLGGGQKTIETSAELRQQSENLNMWVEADARVREADLTAAVEQLEQKIILNNRAFFGDEAEVGGDSRINILHLANIGGTGGNTVVAGYFSSADFYPTTANEFSNERKMLYISLASASLASDEYFQVVAHELQHMIHASVDSNETSWVNEGMAELASYVNGYDEVNSVSSFLALPDVQLNDWSETGAAEGLAHYGGSFLYNAYFLERFGDAAMQTLVSQPENGFRGVAKVFETFGVSDTPDEFFADWIVTNYLAGIGREEPPYTYRNLELDPLKIETSHTKFPVVEIGAVNQYGTDYLKVSATAPVQFEFTGSQQSQLLPTAPHSGDYFVTTFPADQSDMTMTRAFDLTEVETDEITMTFATWYQIEQGWDYGYVMVSADEGQTWQMLPSIYSTTADPHGNNYGVGLTGKSGLESDPVWADVNVDLSGYKGRSVLIRFEYITDDAVFEAGWAIDDVRIPAVDYVETFENGLNGWELFGWARHSNRLPQTFILQAIYVSDATVKIEPLPLTINQQGSFTLMLDNEFSEVVITVSGSTPVTKQPSAYRYTLSQ